MKSKNVKGNERVDVIKFNLFLFLSAWPPDSSKCHLMASLAPSCAGHLGPSRSKAADAPREKGSISVVPLASLFALQKDSKPEPAHPVKVGLEEIVTVKSLAERPTPDKPVPAPGDGDEADGDSFWSKYLQRSPRGQQTVKSHEVIAAIPCDGGLLVTRDVPGHDNKNKHDLPSMG